LCGTCAWLVEGQASAQVDPPPAVSPELSYTLTSAGGGVYAFGHAQFYGSLPSEHVTPAKPIVGIATTADDVGYWLVAADGGIFAFGDAGFYGSTGSDHLNSAIVGMAATPDGRGYWLVAADGGVFAFGDAGFYGSTGTKSIARPVVGISATPDGRGYWLVAADGGVFSFGDAGFYGAADPTTAQPGTSSQGSGIGPNTGFFCDAQGSYFTSNADVVQARTTVAGIQSTTDGRGYYLFGSDGGIFAYGDAQYQGPSGQCLNTQSQSVPLDGPAVGIAF
jgi:hypothetical protein